MGFEDNIETYGIVSGLYNSVYCFGAFLGPVVGGSLVDHLDFGWTSTVTAGLYWIVCLVSILYFGGLQLYANKDKGEYAQYKKLSLTSEFEEYDDVDQSDL